MTDDTKLYAAIEDAIRSGVSDCMDDETSGRFEWPRLTRTIEHVVRLVSDRIDAPEPTHVADGLRGGVLCGTPIEDGVTLAFSGDRPTCEACYERLWKL